MRKIPFYAALLAAQVLLILAVCLGAQIVAPYLLYAGIALGVIAGLFIIGGKQEKRYLVLWLLLVLAVPVFGLTAFLLYADKDVSVPAFNPDAHAFGSNGELNLIGATKRGKNVRADGILYYPDGETFFDDLIKAVGEAKKEMYLEFYLIAKGKVWDRLYKELVKGVNTGVKTEIVYDPVGSLERLPKKDLKNLRKQGATVYAYGKNKWLIGKNANFRTHRKIALIDGRILFDGGRNIADEYLGTSEKLGKFKDASVKLTGDFENLTDFIKAAESPNRAAKEGETENLPGFYFSCGLLADEKGTRSVMEELLLTELYRAEKSAVLTTPYLILDDALCAAFASAVRRGVKVVAIIPAVPDKKIVYESTLACAEKLVKTGVKVLRYKGFIHAKTALFDDEKAIVGSYNLDYRSLYLTRESAVYFTEFTAVSKLKEDIDATAAECDPHLPVKAGWGKKIARFFLRLFEPLM